MNTHYNVERLELVTAKQLREIGFNDEMIDFLKPYEVTKDELVLAMESNYDENQMVETLISEILMARKQVADGAVAAVAPEHEEEPEIVVSPEVAEDSSSKLPEDGALIS